MSTQELIERYSLAISYQHTESWVFLCRGNESLTPQDGRVSAAVPLAAYTATRIAAVIADTNLIALSFQATATADGVSSPRTQRTTDTKSRIIEQ